MAEPALRAATYADLEAVPAHLVAEIVDGVLETRPSLPFLHNAATTALSGELNAAFARPPTRPDRWIFAYRPEIHFGDQIVVPDLAAWRRSSLPTEPKTAYFETPPDWICEVLIKPNARLARGPKRRIYAQFGVGSYWLFDPVAGFIETFALTGGQWLLLGTVVRGEPVNHPPFDAVSFLLDDLFAFDPAPPES